MIELLIGDLCTGCDRCVVVCPTNVFDPVQNDLPVIARQDDCHTCMACELHCPADALYVSPRGEPEPAIDEAQIRASGVLGSYQRALGWRKARPNGSDDDPGVLLKFKRQPDPGDKVRMQLYEIETRKYI